MGAAEERPVVTEEPLEQAPVLGPQHDACLDLRRGRASLDAHPLDGRRRGRGRDVDARMGEGVGAAPHELLALRTGLVARHLEEDGGAREGCVRHTPSCARDAAEPTDFAGRRARFGHDGGRPDRNGYDAAAVTRAPRSPSHPEEPP